MPAPSAQKLGDLRIEDRLKLVQELWDSIAADADQTVLPTATSERELLSARLADDDAEPSSAIPWDDARARLLPPR